MVFGFRHTMFHRRSFVSLPVLLLALQLLVKISHCAPLEADTETLRNSSIITADLNESEDRAKPVRSPTLEQSSDKPDLVTQIRYQLLENQKNLLRLIGLVDRSWENFGEALRNTTFSMVLEAQKSFGKAYHSFPPFVNPLIQRIGSLFGSGGDQLNQVLNTHRGNVKGFLDNWEDHEHDFHHVFQDRFQTINRDLGVPPLPSYNFTWT